MFKPLRILTLLSFLCIPLSVSAQASDPAGPFNDVQKSVLLSSAAFTAVTMGSAREIDAIKTQGFSALTFDIEYTWDTGASAVTMTCEHGATSSTIDKKIHVIASYTSATANSDVHTWSNLVSASEKWSWTVTILPGYNYVQCTFTVTGGDANDLLTLTAWAR